LNPAVILLHPSLPDLKTNVLVDKNGHACLAGFSLLTITPDESTVSSSAAAGGTVRWMGPELLDPEVFGLKESHPTQESDCYALGMVIYEVLSGQKPFAQSTRETTVIFKVLHGDRPSRPQGKEGTLFTDDIWRVLELCWKPQPRDRISAKAVLLGLEGNMSPLRLDTTASNSGMHPVSFQAHPELPLHYNRTPGSTANR
jgi:hypothetical protein